MKKAFIISTCWLIAIAILMAVILGLHIHQYYRYGNIAASEIRQDTVVQYNVTVPTDSGQYFNYLQKELSSYRAYIEKEKKEYYSFLTRVYGVTGVVVTLVAILIAFLGFNAKEKALEQVEAKLEEIKKEAFQQANLSFREEIRQVIQEKKAVEILTEIVQREHLWKGARLKVFFSRRSTTKDEPPEEILSFFHQRKVEVDETELEIITGDAQESSEAVFSKWDFSKFDMVIYFYDPETKKVINDKEEEEEVPEEDHFLISLINQLKNTKLPLIVYTRFAPRAWIPPGSETHKAFKEYPYGTPSNNIITLYANTYDAFNLRLVKQNNAQA